MKKLFVFILFLFSLSIQSMEQWKKEEGNIIICTLKSSDQHELILKEEIAHQSETH